MTNPQMMNDHVPNELLAAFADGRLRGEERKTVIHHLANCDECRDDLLAINEAKELDVIEGGKVVKGNFVQRAVMGAVAAAAVIAILFLPPVQEWIEFQRTGGVSELVKASELLTERPTEARLSGGFSHKRFRVMRGGRPEEMDAAAHYRLLDAAAKVQEHGDARAVGLALLLTSKRMEDRQLAIDALEKAVNANPNDPQILNDCAAAYLERYRFAGGIIHFSGHETRDSRTPEDASIDPMTSLELGTPMPRPKPKLTADLKRAVDLTDRAWTLKKTPEIAWNRALALTYADSPAAKQAWQDYLQLDSSSEWAQEVRDKYLG